MTFGPDVMEGVLPQQLREPHRVAESVNQELKNTTSDINLQTLHGDLKDVQGEVQKIYLRLDALSHNCQPVQTLAPATESLQPTVPASAYNDLQLAYNDLKLQADKNIDRLQQVLDDQNKEIEKYKRANGSLERLLADNKTKVASLQKMVLRAGRKEDVPMDNDIQGRFVTLKGDILNLVKNHFGKSVLPRGGYAKSASPDVSELLIRAKVAKQLYLCFFSPTVKLFGVEDERNDNLFKWVEESVLAKRTNHDELVEWRASSVRMAKMLAAGHQARYPIKMKEQIWEQIRNNCHHSRDNPERDRANRDLETLCDKTFEIALLLRETKIEYEWDQDIERLPSLATNHKDYEILGTTGPTIDEPHGIHRIVFGGVIRGDRATGRLKDGRTRLFPTCVVITE